MTPGMTTSKAEFSFRVWVHPEDGDSADIEVWYQGLESTEPNTRSVADWAAESLSNEDFHRLFDLDTDKHWQVVGKGVLRVIYSLGEYDEELSIVEFSKAEVKLNYRQPDYRIYSAPQFISLEEFADAMRAKSKELENSPYYLDSVKLSQAAQLLDPKERK